MKTRLILHASLLVFLCACVAAAQTEDVEVTTQHVSGNVHMLTGKGGNIGISAGKDGVLIVDDQFDYLYHKIKEAVDSIKASDVKYVLNTHYHGDHTGGNALFKQSGSTIIAHENVRTRLAKDNVRKLSGRVVEAKPETFWPVITFDRSVTLYFNGERIDVIHFPTGHTDGDSVIHFRGSNVIHTGDQFFNGVFPFIDVDSGGSVDGYIENAQKILYQIRDDTQIIPGHGPLAVKSDLEKFVVMLKEARSFIKNAIAEGKTLEEAQKSALPESMTKVWGQGFMTPERWIRILYTFYAQ